MKNKKAIAIIFLISILSVTIISLTALFVSASNTDRYTCLIAGLDYANENTDVLIVANLDTQDGSVSFIQIPRDTYYDYGGGNNKINGLYAHYKSKGSSDEDALRLLTKDLEQTFGICIDASLAIAPDVFRRLVDEIGGVTVSVREDMILEDEHGIEKLYLRRGENLLMGRDSEIFVRYRKGYAMGDLARVNAQKIFISALYKKLTKLSQRKILSLIASIRDDVTLDLKIAVFLKIAIKNQGRNNDANVKFVTLPGEALLFHGISYYVLNRDASCEVLSSYLGADCFDDNAKLLIKGAEAFENIYYETDFEYIEYSSDTVNDARVR